MGYLGGRSLPKKLFFFTKTPEIVSHYGPVINYSSFDILTIFILIKTWVWWIFHTFIACKKEVKGQLDKMSKLFHFRHCCIYSFRPSINYTENESHFLRFHFEFPFFPFYVQFLFHSIISINSTIVSSFPYVSIYLYVVACIKHV